MGIWEFLSDPANQKTIAWLGGGLSVGASALWAAWLTFRKPSGHPPGKSPSAPAARSVSQRDGLAAAGNISVGGDVSVGRIPLPVYLLGAAGLAAIVFAIFFAGDTVCVGTGVAAGGDISGGTITVDGATSAELKC